jgi:hypothetical protein
VECRLAHLLVAVGGRLDQSVFDPIIVWRVIQHDSTPPPYRRRSVTKPVEEGVTGVRQRTPEFIGDLPASRRLEERRNEVLVAQPSPFD